MYFPVESHVVGSIYVFKFIAFFNTCMLHFRKRKEKAKKT